MAASAAFVVAVGLVANLYFVTWLVIFIFGVLGITFCIGLTTARRLVLDHAMRSVTMEAALTGPQYIADPSLSIREVRTLLARDAAPPDTWVAVVASDGYRGLLDPDALGHADWTDTLGELLDGEAAAKVGPGDDTYMRNELLGDKRVLPVVGADGAYHGLVRDHDAGAALARQLQRNLPCWIVRLVHEDMAKPTPEHGRPELREIAPIAAW